MPFQSAQKFIPDCTSFEFVALDAIKATQLRLGLEYWQTVRGFRRFPSRDDIKPRDISGVLQHMSLLKVKGDDFIYRIVGDAIVRAFDLPIQNRRVSDVAFDEPGFDVIVLPLLRKVVETG